MHLEHRNRTASISLSILSVCGLDNQYKQQTGTLVRTERRDPRSGWPHASRQGNEVNTKPMCTLPVNALALAHQRVSGFMGVSVDPRVFRFIGLPTLALEILRARQLTSADKRYPTCHCIRMPQTP